MKTAILGNINRLKRPKGNIHFGKMLLILFLILGQVLVVNSNKVDASGVTNIVGTGDYKYYRVNGFPTPDGKFSQFYTTSTSDFASIIKTLNLYNEEIGIYEIPYLLKYQDSAFAFPVDEGNKLYILGSSRMGYGSDIFRFYISWSGSGYTATKRDYYSNQETSGTASVGYSVSNNYLEKYIYEGGNHTFTRTHIIDQIQGIVLYNSSLIKESKPIPGLESQGYKYDVIMEYDGREIYYHYSSMTSYISVNSTPTITVASPTQNSYFSKVNQA